jgi:hypothetical protein
MGRGQVLRRRDHSRAGQSSTRGGRYVCAPGGNPPPVPNEIAENLSEAAEPETYRLLTPKELEDTAREFVATYAQEKEPWALAPILDNFDPTPGSRHASMYDTLCWAMREAKAGRFSAQHALDELKGLWDESFGIGEARNPIDSEAEQSRAEKREKRNLARLAKDVARFQDVEARRQELMEKARQIREAAKASGEDIAAVLDTETRRIPDD